LIMTRSYAPLVAVLVAAFLVLAPKTALAYPWMIRHEYTSCATCHSEPSGGGLLTEYGRAQSAILLSSHYGNAEEEEPGKIKDFLFGIVPTPENVLLGGWIRNGYLWSILDGKVVDNRFLQMRADLGTQVKISSVRASGSLGFAAADTSSFSHEAWVTHNAGGANLVSREHWVGVDLADDAVLLRAGRLNLPFGLRNIEHTAWARSATRTDTNQQQQHGVSVAYTGEKFRGEFMAILGNYQLSPDAYRERGYSGLLELSLSPRYAIGVSSLVAHAEADINSRVGTTRQAHGVFARLAPARPLVILAEADALIRTEKGSGTSAGVAGLVQADYEVTRGVHLMATGEVLKSGSGGLGVGGWVSAWWFVFPHVDARIDLIERKIENSTASTSVLLQLHAYL
jgi:hypothetical protein